MASKTKQNRISGTRASERKANEKRTSDKKINMTTTGHTSHKVDRKRTSERIANKKKSSKKTASEEKGQHTECKSRRHHSTRIALADKPISKCQRDRAMIIAAFADIRKPRTLSRQAILNYFSESFEMKNKGTTNLRFKIALKSCVTNGYLKQIKGHGANGRFALVKKQTNKLSTSRHKAAKRKGSKFSAKTPSSKQNKGASKKNSARQVIKTARTKKPNKRSTSVITEKQSKNKLRGSSNNQQSNISVNRQGNQALKPGQIDLTKYVFIDPRPQDVFLRNPTW